MRALVLAAAVCLLPLAADAGPINLVITDSLDGTIANQDTLAGTNSFTGSSAHFDTISVDATPSAGADLGTVSLDLTSGGAGPHVLTIDATQTGLSFAAASSETTFTYNGLEGGPGPNTDTMLVNGVVLGTHTFPAATGVDDFGPIAGGPELITSNEEEFRIAFTGPGQEFEGTIEFIAAAAAVPEPSTLALFGTCLVAGWLAFRRRREGAELEVAGDLPHANSSSSSRAA